MRAAASGALGAVFCLALAASQAWAQEPGLLVTVGEVTASSAGIWARTPGGGPLTLDWSRAGSAPEPGRSLATRLQSDRTVKAVLSGLEPATRYRYSLAGEGMRVEGEFATAPKPDVAAPVRLAWSGDLGSSGNCRRVPDGYPIFRALQRYPVDLFLFVGDTIYADHACWGPGFVAGSEFVARTLPQFHAKHRYNRADPGVQEYFRRTPVYAIWDDHEVRNDFSGPPDAQSHAGLRAFIDYFPLRPPPEDPERLYRSVRWGALLEVFILDTRQYRSPNTDPDGPDKTMLGAAQKRWLIDGVPASTAVWKIVVSSVALSVPKPEAARDAWSNANPNGAPDPAGTGFAVERDQILRELRVRGVRNLVFLAADVHHAELIRHEPAPGWSFHEFLAGPLSASPGRPRPLDRGLNPRSLWAEGGFQNFGEVAIDTGALTVRIIDVDGRVRYTHTIVPEH